MLRLCPSRRQATALQQAEGDDVHVVTVTGVDCARACGDVQEEAVAKAKTAKAELDAHVQLDYDVNNHLNELDEIGKENANVEHANRKPDDPPPKLCSWDGIMQEHADDKETQNVPATYQKSSDGLGAHHQNVHGGYLYVTDLFAAVLPEPGIGSKDTNSTIDMVLLMIIAYCAGEKVFNLVLDGASTGYNKTLPLYLCYMLVRLGIFETALVTFLAKEHSKNWVDKFFGILADIINRLINIWILEYIGLGVSMIRRKVGQCAAWVR